MTRIEPHTPLDALLGATPRRVLRHWLSLLLLALAGLAALVFFVRFVTGDNSPYYSAPVERGNLVPLISERGIVRGTGEVTAQAMLDGRIAWISGKRDAQVERGELLARIDAREIHRRIAIDRSSLAAAQARLEAAQVAAQSAAARLARFENVWRRSGGRAPSFNEMETARAEGLRTSLALDAARAELKTARLRLEDDKAKAARAEVRAPISGVLVLRQVEPGQWVNEHQPLFTIAAGIAPLTVEVPLTARPAGPIQAGTLARVRLDSMPDKVQSARLSLLKVPPPPQSAPPRAVFTLERPDPQARPGMAATIEIELPERKNVLLVPDAALAFEPGNPDAPGRRRARVYLLSSDGEPRRVYVVVGGSDGQRTEIFATGIQPGDQIITGWRDPAAGPKRNEAVKQ
ncbi:efflux RND transporter periplasmic adaptor subunit [Novosphingobium sp. CF614]|uniref:efflux RND transporter periplasmic adaptor subunit n=1 Tax=Novosphingobium sp. CF614 TaxID=1884364 RepID=UPI0015A5ABC8|nr:efflux RND transporter periplasmic adaptor subunit [Novosphingobium sp. CF614]